MSRFADLSSRLSADLPNEQNPNHPIEDDEDETAAVPKTGDKSKSKKKDEDMSEETVTAEDHAKALADATVKATADANARFNAVMASEHYTGRETLAANLLGNAVMTAEAITSALAVSPKIEPSAIGSELIEAKAEEAARAEMRSAIDQTANAAINVAPAGVAGADIDEKAVSDASWAKAYGLNEKGVK